MSGSTDSWKAQLDRECERIMKMSIEELAAEDGQTVEEAIEEGRQCKERVMAVIRRKFPDFGKD